MATIPRSPSYFHRAPPDRIMGWPGRCNSPGCTGGILHPAGRPAAASGCEAGKDRAGAAHLARRMLLSVPTWTGTTRSRSDPMTSKKKQAIPAPADRDRKGVVQAPPLPESDRALDPDAAKSAPGADEAPPQSGHAVPKRRAPPAILSQGVVAPRAEPSTQGKRRQSGDRQQR
jgi:hypothetical protein